VKQPKEFKMDKRFLCLGLLLLFCLFSGGSFAIDNVTYKHPTLNIQFEAEENWRRIRRPEDNNSYEIVDPNGSDQKKPIRTILATIPHGMSAEYPKEFSLFLLQIWCPEEDYESCRMSMESILNSVLILQ
jgi:hypothetical protein